MTAAPTKLLTADEFFWLPDDGKLYELEEGRLVEVGGASPRSSAVAAAVLILLGVYVRQHKLGVVGGADWRAKLFSDPDTVRNPDVCFTRAERLPGDKVPNRHQEGAPDLVVEVLSPSDRYRRTVRRVREYLAAGARMVVVIDPDERSAAVHRPDGSMEDYEADGVMTFGDLLPGFSLNLAEIWVESDDQD